MTWNIYKSNIWKIKGFTNHILVQSYYNIPCIPCILNGTLTKWNVQKIICTVMIWFRFLKTGPYFQASIKASIILIILERILIFFLYARSIYFWYQNMDIIEPADGLAPLGARLSAGTMLTRSCWWFLMCFWLPICFCWSGDIIEQDGG